MSSDLGYNEAMEIKSALWNDGILFTKASSKAEALEQVIALASRHPAVSNARALADGIHARERIISTGIGLGVAIPHAKIRGISHFFICVAILEEGIDWDAIDDEPVRIIFLIAGPDSQQNQYLQLLARLSLAIKKQTRRAAILNAHDPLQIQEILTQP